MDVFFTGFQFCNYKFGSVTFVRHFFLCGFPVLRVKGLTNKLDSLGTFVYPNCTIANKTGLSVQTVTQVGGPIFLFAP